MLSINTNLSSLIVQNNLTQSTNALNTAIERMTTGYKLNHASDNAAGYSIAEDMSSKLSSYMVAQDNISAGMDLIATAQDTISLMQSHGQRIHALITQAHNGTYGAGSLSAIQSEVNARLAEITRLYNTTEYNGIDLLNGIQLPDWAETVKANAGVNLENADGKFIAEAHHIDDDEVNALTHVASLSNFTSGQTYAVSTKADLEKLSQLVNEGKSTTNVTFVMGADIDLGGEEWTAIGNFEGYDDNKTFKGIFDGNGHVIKNLKIDKTTQDSQGLFGYTASGSTIKNVGIEGANVTGRNSVGALVGYALGNSTITNSYATGNVTGTGDNTGGLVGYADGSITNSYATGTVTGTGQQTGGLVGTARGSITNSYATGNVTGQNQTGGLVGYASGSITNSYATGSVTGTGYFTGGLVGYASGSITNSYATGTVTGTGSGSTGGLVGYASSGSITNSYAEGNVTGQGGTGGLIGRAGYHDDPISIVNSFSIGNISGEDNTGAIIGVHSDDPVITFNNIATTQNDLELIGDGYSYNSTGSIDNIEAKSTTLQVGINGDTSSQITFGTSLNKNLNVSDVSSDSAYDSINAFLESLSARATELGAISNRLESALESTSVQIDNLTSSRSTIKDADIAKVSSEYIRHQILQQASATLLATANQSPSIALQLI